LNEALVSARRLVPEKWSLVVQILPLVAAILVAKLAVYWLDLSFIELSTLFGSVVAANVFLLGFLLAGTLGDYKESERLPSELAASIESIADECLITWRNKQAPQAREAASYIHALAGDVWRWFHKEVRTNDMLARIEGLNRFFLEFESLTQPNFIVRMKQEQNNIRRLLLRIDTIRDTSFVSVGYAVAELGTGLLIFGLLCADISPLEEAMFYVGAVSFLMLYLIFLIRDLDNPFDYYKGGLEAAHVSLKAIEDVRGRLEAHVAEPGGSLPASAATPTRAEPAASSQ
jgi:hypothetical protein